MPYCPKCGAKTTLRTSKKDGCDFHVCVNYPKCKGKVSVDEAGSGNWDGNKPLSRTAQDMRSQRIERSLNISAKENKNFNFKEYPTNMKRGLCIYITGFTTVNDLIQELFKYYEKKIFRFRKESHKEQRHKIIHELGTYFLYETVKQLTEYEKSITQDDAMEILDTVFYQYTTSYRINDVREKFKELDESVNPFERVSGNIQRILGRVDLEERFQICVKISACFVVPEYSLFNQIHKIFSLSDIEMTKIITEFFSNPAAKLL